MAQYVDEYSWEQDAYRAWQQEQARRAAQAQAAARARAQEQAREAVRAAAAARERAAAQARAAEEARARAAAQAEAAARARAQEQAQAAARQQAAQRERAAAEQARAAAQAAQAQAAGRARAQEQAQAVARQQASERERAAAQARATEQARVQEQAAAAAEALAAEEARAAADAQAAEQARTAERASATEQARARAAEEARAAADARAAAPGPPPRGTPAYDAYLKEMLNATTRGVAPGVGSISEPGEPARRSGAPELTLAEKLRDGFIPGGGSALAPPRKSEPAPEAGPPPRGTAAYDAYLKEMLNATTQGIASGVGSISEPGDPARRGGAKELTLAQKLAGGLGPKSGAGVTPPTRTTVRASEAGPPPRDSPEYYTYLREMLNGTPQGVAPGVGSISEPGEPARRTGAPELTLAQRLADGFTPGSGARSVSDGPREPRSGGQPEMSPETEEQLWDAVLAQEESAYGGGRSAYTELLKDQQLWDEALAGDEATSVGSESGYERALNTLRLDEVRRQEEEAERVLVEPAAIIGPGARTFEVTPDEESFWAARSPDEFISEELIEIHKRGEFNDEDVAIMEQHSPEAGQRAGLIAYYDQQGRRGRNDVDVLRAGVTLPDGDWGVGVPQSLTSAAETAVDVGVAGLDLGAGAAEWAIGVGLAGANAGGELGREAAEGAFDIGRDAFDFGLDFSDAAIDFGLDRAGDAIELAEPFDVGIVNPTFGAVIAAMTDCQDERVLPPIRPGDQPVVFHENCGDAAVFRATGGRPFTVGSHVFVPTTLKPGGFTEREELYHAAQAAEAGDLFLVRYLLDSLANGYDGNAFEVGAKNFAGGQSAPLVP